MGYQRRSRAASGHRAWEREHSKRLICSSGRSPMGFWYAPGFFVPPPAYYRQRPATGFVKELPDHVQHKQLDYRAVYMAPNSYNTWDQPGFKTEQDPATPESEWSPSIFRNNNEMMNGSYPYMEPASSPFHASSFSGDPYHVSPVASPETTTNRELMVPPSQSQVQPQQSTHYNWSAAAPFLGYQTGFSTTPDWQTIPPQYETAHGPLPYQEYGMLPYLESWRDPMDSVEYNTPQTGSFSSPDSSSCGTSFTSSFAVQDSWPTHGLPDMTDMTPQQYSLRPRLLLPCAEERDTSLEGTVSPKLTRIIPSPSFQSAPSSPRRLLHRDSDSSSSEGNADEQPPAHRQSQSSRHQRTRLPSPESSRHTCSSSRSIRSSHELPHSPASNPTQVPTRPGSRAAKDDFLLKAKAKGMTYKEIRSKGGFSEAESTLRGRYRTLTKPKDLRVRKPEWSDNDLRLLEKSVRRSIHRGQNPTTAKIPWREVAEYIFQNGGSYLFGLSTCRKRWDELVLAETARGKDAGRPFYEQR